MKKWGMIAVAAGFLCFIAVFVCLHLALPDASVSISERRKLQQLPSFSMSTVASGQFMSDVEKYLADQFPFRDAFRTIQAYINFDLLGKKDSGGIYLVDGQVGKLETTLQEDQIEYAAQKINQIAEKYLQGSKLYFSIIPDKNVYLASPNGYPSIDYSRLVDIAVENVKSAEYINLFDLLSKDDFFRTDTHWLQPSIFPVVDRLCQTMGVSVQPASAYTVHTLSPFYGVYYGQAALPVEPDSLPYLTSGLTESAVVTGAEFSGEKPVYDLEQFEGMDGYNVFLSGPQSVLTVDCPTAETDRELILFRDSFGSSLAPLLLGAYSRITLVDLRYISSDLLGDYVDFHGQDVLFLYSSSLLNSGRLLK